MEWLFLILLLACGVAIAVMAAIPCARTAQQYLKHALDSLEEDSRVGPIRAAERLERRAAKKRWERRFAIAAGEYTAVDHDAVEAAKQLPIIREAIHQHLPEAIVRCLRTHRLAASAARARYIWEIARQPECVGLRYRVVGLAEAAIDALQRCAMLPELEKDTADLIALRSLIVPICRNCPYLEHETAKAPMRCEAAIKANIDEKRCRDDK